MRIVVQRVSRGTVRVGEEMVGSIGPGLLVLAALTAVIVKLLAPVLAVLFGVLLWLPRKLTDWSLRGLNGGYPTVLRSALAHPGEVLVSFRSNVLATGLTPSGLAGSGLGRLGVLGSGTGDPVVCLGKTGCWAIGRASSFYIGNVTCCSRSVCDLGEGTGGDGGSVVGTGCVVAIAIGGDDPAVLGAGRSISIT